MNCQHMIFAGSTYGIPMLDLSMQADAISLPFLVWGQSSRSAVTEGTYCFYTHDYKFSAIYKRPDALINTCAVAAVEVNFSTSIDQPEAVVIHDVFKKRWLSRYWQSNGIRMIVDLNVDERWLDLNMIGVPDGWSCFATRAHRGKNNEIEQMYLAAEAKCGRRPSMFLVYGGGTKIAEMCSSNGWLHIHERMSEIKKGSV